MKVNKKGQRSIHLHDEDAILYVENLAKDLKCSLYEATEKIIYDRISGEQNVSIGDPEAVKHYESEIIIDRCGSGQIIDALLNNGYTLLINPIAGNTGFNEKLLITFERKEG